VPVASRTPTALDGRRSSGWRALAKANQVRVARARPKREVAAGRIELARVVAEPPACAQTAKVRELLLVVLRIGPARADRLLARCRIAYAKTVTGLSERQRAELVELHGRARPIAGHARDARGPLWKSSGTSSPLACR
jgi:hypothetical protein